MRGDYIVFIYRSFFKRYVKYIIEGDISLVKNKFDKIVFKLKVPIQGTAYNKQIIFVNPEYDKIMQIIEIKKEG